MKNSTTRASSLGIVALSFAAAGLLYLRQPGTTEVFALPVVITAVYVLLGAIGRIAGADRFRRAWTASEVAILTFLLVVTVLGIAAAGGASLPVDSVVTSGFGAVVVVLGNYMGTVPRNSAVGLRTRWTLASDEVWRRANRFSGRALVITGASLFLIGFFYGGVAPILGAVAVVAIVSTLYSRRLYRQLHTASSTG